MRLGQHRGVVEGIGSLKLTNFVPLQPRSIKSKVQVIEDVSTYDAVGLVD